MRPESTASRSNIARVLSEIDVSTFPIPLTLFPSNCGTKVSCSLQAPDTRARGGLKVRAPVKAGGMGWPPHSVDVAWDDDFAIIEAAREAVCRALAHEVDEHFKFRGVLFTDPHPVQK